MKAKPFSPFTWPHVGRQWPEYNIWSPQAEGLVAWWPMLGDQNSWPVRDLASKRFPMTPFNSPTWVADGERGWSVLFNDAASEYLEVSSTPVIATPLTMVCWFYVDDVSPIQDFFSLADAGSFNNYISLGLGGNPRDNLQLARRDADTNDTLLSANTTLNTWHHACAVLSADNDATLFLRLINPTIAISIVDIGGKFHVLIATP